MIDEYDEIDGYIDDTDWEYRHDVTYPMISISAETEDKFYARGQKLYDSFLEWIDEEEKELLKEFEKTALYDFGEFCLKKWIDEKYEV